MDKASDLSSTLIRNLEDSFRGDPWYGISLMKKLDQIDHSIVNIAPIETTNTIARLVQHIINWRLLAIKKLEGDTEFDIEVNTTDDWTDITINSADEWNELKQKLVQTQQKLSDLLEERSDELLTQSVPGRSYDFRFLIEGIIQHDIYHLGQIGIVAKQATKLTD